MSIGNGVPTLLNFIEKKNSNKRQSQDQFPVALRHCWRHARRTFQLRWRHWQHVSHPNFCAKKNPTFLHNTFFSNQSFFTNTCNNLMTIFAMLLLRKFVCGGLKTTNAIFPFFFWFGNTWCKGFPPFFPTHKSDSCSERNVLKVVIQSFLK